MNSLRKFLFFFFVALLCVRVEAQKVEVGYDKSTDFLKFTTYSWMEPSTPPTRPLLYARVIDSVDHQLERKGLTYLEKDSDMIIVPAGGMEFGINVAAQTPIIPSYGGPPPAVNATMWSGAGYGANLMAPYVPQGSLALTFIDRVNNKVIWSGTVQEKLDVNKKDKSLQLVDKAIAKLLSRFPPQKK